MAFPAASQIQLDIGSPKCFTAFPGRENEPAEFEAQLYLYGPGEQKPTLVKRIVSLADTKADVDIERECSGPESDSVIFLLAMRVCEPGVNRAPLQSLTSEEIFDWIGADPSSLWATGAMWETIFFRREDKAN